MSDSVEDIKARYAEEAKSYRENASKINFEAEKCFKVLLAYLGELFPDKCASLKVLDVGAGTGMLSEYILREYPNAHVTLLDNSREMLLQAESYFESIGGGYYSRISLCERDFITDVFPEDKYDLVLSSFALHHIRTDNDLRNVFCKIYQVLKPEIGTFFCIDYFLKNYMKDIMRQVERAIYQWEQKGYTHDEAITWAKIIESEDTPANLVEILQSLCAAKHQINCLGIPLISPISYYNCITAIYGFTFVKIETLMSNFLLRDLLNSWRFPEHFDFGEEFFCRRGPNVLPNIMSFPVSSIIDSSRQKKQ